MKIVTFEGRHLLGLLDELHRIVEREGLLQVRVAVDGGLKIKVNEGVWTPPLGVVTGEDEPVDCPRCADMDEAEADAREGWYTAHEIIDAGRQS